MKVPSLLQLKEASISYPRMTDIAIYFIQPGKSSSSVHHTCSAAGAISLMPFVFVKALADSVSSQKRAAADGECREESLLQETASKEAAMATRMEEVQAELKQSRLALSNAHAEIERLGVFSSQLKKVLWITKVYFILIL